MLARARAPADERGRRIFRVTGAPVLHDNGTTGATQALHGFPHDRRGGTIPAERDDYLTGETYAPLLRAAGARLPSKGDFGFTETASVDPNHARLKGRYLRWDLQGASEIVLEPGGAYAFLILIDGDRRGARAHPGEQLPGRLRGRARHPPRRDSGSRWRRGHRCQHHAEPGHRHHGLAVPATRNRRLRIPLPHTRRRRPPIARARLASVVPGWAQVGARASGVECRCGRESRPGSYGH